MQDSASLLVWARVGVCDLGITGFHYNTLANSLLPPKARASEDSVRKWAFAFWNGECGVRMRLNVLRGSLLAIPFHCGNKFLFRSRNSHSGWESLSLCGAIFHHPNGSHGALLLQFFELLCDSCCHVPDWWCCTLS